MIKSMDELGSNRSFIRRLLKYYYSDQQFSDHSDGRINDDISMVVPGFKIPQIILELAPGVVLIKERFYTNIGSVGYFKTGFFAVGDWEFKKPKKREFNGDESYQIEVEKLRQRNIAIISLLDLGDGLSGMSHKIRKILSSPKNLNWHVEPKELAVEKVSRFYFPKKFDPQFFSDFFKEPEPFDYEKLTEAEKKEHDRELEEIHGYLNSDEHKNLLDAMKRSGMTFLDVSEPDDEQETSK